MAWNFPHQLSILSCWTVLHKMLSNFTPITRRKIEQETCNRFYIQMKTQPSCSQFISSKKEPLAKFSFQFLVYIWPTVCQVLRLLFLSFSTPVWEITSSLRNIHAYSPFLKLMFPYIKLSARSWQHPKHRFKIVLRNTYILYYSKTQGQTLSRTWDSSSFPTVTKCKPVYCSWRRQKETSKVLWTEGKNKCYRGQCSHLA